MSFNPIKTLPANDSLKFWKVVMGFIHETMMDKVSVTIPCATFGNALSFIENVF